MNHNIPRPYPRIFLLILIVMLYHASMYVYYHPNWVYRLVGGYLMWVLILVLHVPTPTPSPLIQLELDLAHSILKLHNTNKENENEHHQQYAKLESI
jgi:hypothetical protein